MGNKFVRGGGDSKFTKPTGLYPTCEWDDKAVKKLIVKKKVAPRYPGREEPGPELDECPICFLVRALPRAPREPVRACCCSRPPALTPAFWCGRGCGCEWTVVPWRPESLEVLQATHLHRVLPAVQET